MTPKPPTIAYVGGFCFPDKDAGAVRVLGIGKALREAGHAVVFAGVEKVGREEDRQSDGNYVYQGFRYLPERNLGTGVRTRLMRLLFTHLTAATTMHRFRGLQQSELLAVIAYQPSVPLFCRLRALCRRRRVTLLSDVVEWYDRSHVPGGRCGPCALDSEVRMRWALPKSDGLIGISSYLVDYYRQHGVPTMRVPVLVDLQEPQWTCPVPTGANGGGLTLAFVGNAGKKDHLTAAFRGLAKLRHSSATPKMLVVGPSRTQLEKDLGRDCDVLQVLGKQVEFAGHLPRPEALKRLAKADFTILLRPEARFAHAGFPTKLVESMAMGVPVICNLTSDIGLYVHDGAEGLILPDPSPQSFAAGVERAQALTPEQRAAMRLAARRCAEQNFDYRQWVDSLQTFVGQRTVELRRKYGR